MEPLERTKFEELIKQLEEEREGLIEKLIESYLTYAQGYRTLPFEYKFLLRAKKESKKCRLEIIGDNILGLYPDIPFFRIIETERDGLEAWLEEKTTGELIFIAKDIRLLVDENPAYLALRNWVANAEYRIANPLGGEGSCGKVHQAFSSPKTPIRPRD